MKGRVTQVTWRGEGYAFEVSRRGSVETLRADLAFDCTGHAPDLQQSLLRDLISQGLAHPDAHGLGLVVEQNGAVKDASGCPRRWSLRPWSPRSGLTVGNHRRAGDRGPGRSGGSGDCDYDPSTRTSGACNVGGASQRLPAPKSNDCI